MVLPLLHASDFLLFCQLNPKPCPLIEVMEVARREPLCAPGADVARDLPGYRVYRDGELAAEPADVAELWRDDFVVFLLGCSLSFERALIEAGISLRHLDEGRNVSMYRTSMPCKSAGPLHGELVVSMRPIKKHLVSNVVEITSRFPLAHGSPVHIGDPSHIGVADLSRPDYGDAVRVADDEVAVFWACGVTSQWVAQKSRLPLCITHAPGKMFVTDLKN